MINCDWLIATAHERAFIVHPRQISIAVMQLNINYLPLDYFVYQEPRTSGWHFCGKLVTAVSKAYIWQRTHSCDVCANCITSVNNHAIVKVAILFLMGRFNFNGIFSAVYNTLNTQSFSRILQKSLLHLKIENWNNQ